MPVFKTVSPAGLASAILAASGKFCLNSSGATLAAFRVVAWTPSGSLILADPTSPPINVPGILYAATANGSYGLVLHDGKVPGAAVGLGASAGQPIFLSETPGMLTLNTSSFNPNSAIIQVGFAAPADNTTTPITDILLDLVQISN